MRVLVAPDKFKGSLSGSEAANAMAAGVKDILPEADLRLLPVADGGEGTLDAVLMRGGIRCRSVVQNPMGEPVAAEWAMCDGIAVIESALASGLAHVDPTPKSAGDSHSFGTGELILEALNSGATEIVVGLGGSAMTDGGSGALRALGLRVLDIHGKDIPMGGAHLGSGASIVIAGIDPRLRHTPIRLAVDVNNPLHGPDGAAHVFGAQKGADSQVRNDLDAGLRHWSALLRAATGVDVQSPGAGAAGGFPAAFLALTGATLERGFDLVAELLDLQAAIESADLVLTGEGSLDEQSRFGKAPLGVADRSHDRGIPVVAIAGRILLTAEELAGHGVVAFESIQNTAPSLGAGFTEAATYARQATREALSGLRLELATIPARP
ncbi:glycerate kinase [Pseudarthrobacter sp. SSS035]|uniref:glycerate kinase n=1 Tax=Pseudarthrobacter sp. SSS035 TaxID=2931399 RepID=UPI00200CFEE8|nr:glycerate kinase [Pseudarthrobacter sp. SSS035]